MKQPSDVTVIAQGRRVAGLSVADVGAYLAETAGAPCAEPLALEDDESAVTDALIGQAVHMPRPVVYSQRSE
ncbi:MAG: hypothetical protein IT323_13405 [Anaerolineae bacterium]|nr:hypothetical protein [Anaerolineae bacterium]